VNVENVDRAPEQREGGRVVAHDVRVHVRDAGAHQVGDQLGGERRADPALVASARSAARSLGPRASA
jgi:hypothetical protein